MVRIALEEADPRWLYTEQEEKARRYINDPSEAPEGAEVEEGPQGGLYYETEGADGAGEEEEGADEGGDFSLEDVEMYDRLFIDGEIGTVVEISDNSLEIANPKRFGTGDYEVYDGHLLEVNHDGRVEEGGVGYYEFSPDVDVPDGWYEITEFGVGDERYVAEFTSPNGDTFTTEVTDIETRKEQVEVEPLRPTMERPWENYEPGYPAGGEVPERISREHGDVFDDDQERAIRAGITKAQQYGIGVDYVKRMDTYEEGSQYAEASVMGSFNPVDHSLNFDQVDFSQERVDGLMENQMVADTPEDIVIHELMHAAHNQHLEEIGMSLDEMKKEMIDKRLSEGEKNVLIDDVSMYSATNPLELVAEIGTKVLKGEEVSDAALYLYEKYKGPEL